MGAQAEVQLFEGSMDQHGTGALKRNAGNRRDEGKYAEQNTRHEGLEADLLARSDKIEEARSGVAIRLKTLITER